MTRTQRGKLGKKSLLAGILPGTKSLRQTRRRSFRFIRGEPIRGWTLRGRQTAQRNCFRGLESFLTHPIFLPSLRPGAIREAVGQFADVPELTQGPLRSPGKNRPARQSTVIKS